MSIVRAADTPPRGLVLEVCDCWPTSDGWIHHVAARVPLLLLPGTTREVDVDVRPMNRETIGLRVIVHHAGVRVRLRAAAPGDRDLIDADELACWELAKRHEHRCGRYAVDFGFRRAGELGE
jgi:hypothetical protein